MSGTSTGSSGSSKVYTRGGDKGSTSLIGGQRVPKSHPRLETYGTLDELNSVIGVLRSEIESTLKPDSAESIAIQTQLDAIQHLLFNAGSQLACEDASLRASLPGISLNEIDLLEKQMDEFSLQLAPLKNFILPGGTRAASQAHIARTVARRAERAIVLLSFSEPADTDPKAGAESSSESEVVLKYVNRLSDYFFVLARFLNHLASREEPIWKAGART